MEDKFMNILDSCWELTTEELKSLVAQLEGVIEEREEEEDENNYCVNCGCEKEDYESMYCDKCFEEEERLYEKIGIGVNDTDNGLEISVMGDTDTLKTYNIDIDITKYSKMELYNITKEVAKEITQYYYTNETELPTLEQVKDMVEEQKSII